MKKPKEWIEEVDDSSSLSNSRRRQGERRFGHWSSLVLRQHNQQGGEAISIEAPAISSSTKDQDTYNNVSCDPLLGILGCEEAPSSEQDFQSFEEEEETEDQESHYNSIRRNLSSYTAYDYFCIPGFQNVFDCSCGRLLGGSRTVDCIYRNKWCRYGNPDNFCVDAHYEFELINNDQDIASFQVCLEDLEIRTSGGGGGGGGGAPTTKTVTSCYSFDYREPQSCSYSQDGEYCTNSFVNTRGSGVNQKTCCQFNCRNLYDGVLGNSCNKGQYAFRFLASFLSDFPECSVADDEGGDDATTSPSSCFRNPYLCEELSCNCKDVYDTNGSGTIVCPIQYCFGDDPSYYYYSDTSADNCVSGTKGYDFVNGENMYIEQCLTLVDDDNSNRNSNSTTICYRYDGVDNNGDSSATTCDILINGVSCNVSTCDNSSSSPSFGCQQEFDCSNIPGGRSGLTCNDFPHSSFDKLRNDSPAPTTDQESSSQAPSSSTLQPSSVPRSVPPSDNITPTPTISPSVAFSSSPSVREYDDSSSEEPTKGGTEESSAVPSDTTFSNSPTMAKDETDDSSYLPSTFPTFMEGSNNGPTSKAQISDAPSMITAMPESRQPSPASAAAPTIAPPLGMVWTIIALVYLFAGR